MNAACDAPLPLASCTAGAGSDVNGTDFNRSDLRDLNLPLPYPASIVPLNPETPLKTVEHSVAQCIVVWYASTQLTGGPQA